MAGTQLYAFFSFDKGKATLIRYPEDRTSHTSERDKLANFYGTLMYAPRNKKPNPKKKASRRRDRDS